MAVTGPRSAWPCIMLIVGDKADTQCGIASLNSVVFVYGLGRTTPTGGYPSRASPKAGLIHPGIQDTGQGSLLLDLCRFPHSDRANDCRVSKGSVAHLSSRVWGTTLPG